MYVHIYVCFYTVKDIYASPIPMGDFHFYSSMIFEDFIQHCCMSLGVWNMITMTIIQWTVSVNFILYSGALLKSILALHRWICLRLTSLTPRIKQFILSQSVEIVVKQWNKGWFKEHKGWRDDWIWTWKRPCKIFGCSSSLSVHTELW